jgi:hypothetical protein
MCALALTTIPLIPVHNITQYGFNVVWDATTEKLAYTPKLNEGERPPNVPRNHIGLISIHLDPSAAPYFEDMKISIKKDPSHACTVIDTEGTGVLIVDNNYHSRSKMQKEEIEFKIHVKQKKGGNIIVVDPIIIND